MCLVTESALKDFNIVFGTVGLSIYNPQNERI